MPTINEADTIGAICRSLVDLRSRGVCSRVLIVDESTDDTAQIARRAGAEVTRQSALRNEAGPVLGKGDAMWRALHAIDEDVVVYVDGDTRDFDPGMVVALIEAITSGRADFAKATYRRPWDDGITRRPTGGGRVTELTAKPLLRQLFPELARFEQPLAGEIAAHTALLRSLPFVTGYGVDVALLIDAWRAVGAGRLTEVSASPRQNRHRPLEELTRTADDVVATILHRAGISDQTLPERPAPTTGPVRTDWLPPVLNELDMRQRMRTLHPSVSLQPGPTRMTHQDEHPKDPHVDDARNPDPEPEYTTPDPDVDEQGEESFPASDPPANY